MENRRRIFELFEAQKDVWERRANDGIEAHRKGTANIVLKDKNGNKVNAKIKASQVTHEFRFGANIFMLDELETDEKNNLYKKYFKETFNMATLPFYWKDTEPTQGALRYEKNSPKVYRRPSTDLCMEFCEENGIEPREHALAYEQFFPNWLADKPVEEVKKLLEQRYKEIADRYKDKIHTIEVTNEMDWEDGKTAFYDDPDFLLWCYKKAEEYFPDNQLVVNEATHLAWMDRARYQDKYYAYIENTLLKGGRIDAVGMQYHMFFRRENEFEMTRKTYNPEKLYEFMDMYSEFNKPLQITEITIPAYSNDAEDEKIQAELLENLYTIWFSHPNVEQIIYWNLIDGYAFVDDPNPEKIKKSQGDMTLGENYYYGGLLRFDMSKKPAFETLQNLIKHKWHTEEEFVTNDGTASFRGFFGKYNLEITVDGKTVTRELNLSKNADNNFEITL